MNNDTGGDHPMPGTRMRRLFDENLSMIETMTRIEIRRLGRMPRGTHLGQDDGNPVTDLLPDRYLDRYDREFLYRMLGSTIRLRARLADPKTDHAAHSVIECFASMFVRQVRQCFSAVWADGFPRCRHRFPVM